MSEALHFPPLKTVKAVGRDSDNHPTITEYEGEAYARQELKMRPTWVQTDFEVEGVCGKLIGDLDFDPDEITEPLPPLEELRVWHLGPVQKDPRRAFDWLRARGLEYKGDALTEESFEELKAWMNRNE